MKKSTNIFLLAALIMIGNVALAQDKSKRPSPPAQVSQDVNGTKITIDYSRPSKNDRPIMGGLVKYGEIWRTGANETTWIEVSKDVRVQGQDLPAGKYGLHTIPGKDEWTIIFNSVWKEWGSYRYNKSNDVLRVKAKPMETEATEKFTIDIAKDGTVSLAWETTKVEFSVK